MDVGNYFTIFVFVCQKFNDMRNKLFALFAVSCCLSMIELYAQTNYTISGYLGSALVRYEEGSKISSAYLMSGNRIISEKAAISSDDYFIISGQVDSPVEAFLVVDLVVPGGTGRSSEVFALEKGEIVVEDFSKGVFRGTPLNDAVFNEIEYLKQCPESKEFKFEHVSSFIEEYKRTPAIAVLLQRLSTSGLFSIGEIFDVVNSSDKCILESPFVSALLSNIEKRLNRINSAALTGEGCMFVDFEVEYDGHIQRLSDYAGRGKYVLADFWASWCRPCRSEIPEIIDLYETYKDKGLVVLGVTVNDKPENTIKAISDLNIPYPQIMNGGRLTGEPYGIETIPHLILFGPDGTIVRRGIRIKEMKQFVEEIYK